MRRTASLTSTSSHWLKWLHTGSVSRVPHAEATGNHERQKSPVCVPLNRATKESVYPGPILKVETIHHGDSKPHILDIILHEQDLLDIILHRNYEHVWCTVGGFSPNSFPAIGVLAGLIERLVLGTGCRAAAGRE